MAPKQNWNDVLRLSLGVFVASAIPLGYLLALGPIFWLRSHEYISAETWQVCLYPLYYVGVCDNENWFVRILGDYLRWWQ